MSNFEIGRLSDSVLARGAEDTFSYLLFIILKILGGTCMHTTLFCGPWSADAHFLSVVRLGNLLPLS